MSFSYNGDWKGDPAEHKQLGLAFDNISYHGGLMPAATICGLCGQEVQFNFGDKPMKHKPPPGYQHVWDWVVAYRPKQPRQYISPTMVRTTTETGEDDDKDASETHKCPCGKRHPGSFNGFVPRRTSDLVATSGAGVVSLTQGGNGTNKAQLAARAAHGRPSVILRHMSAPYVGGRRYYEVLIRALDTTAVGASSWRVGWASRGFIGDWARDVGIGDDQHSIGVACVQPSTAIASTLLFGRRGQKHGRVIHPEAVGAATTSIDDVDKLGDELRTLGTGYTAAVESGGTQPIVFELERPGLLSRVAGVNLAAREYAIEYACVPPGLPPPDAEASLGSDGWVVLRGMTRVGRYAAIVWPSKDAGDEDTIGVLASHVRLTVVGAKDRPPSWSQLQVFGVAGPHDPSIDGDGAVGPPSWPKMPTALAALRATSTDSGHGLTHAYGFGLTPAPVRPTPLWVEGTVLCVAVDLAARHVSIRAITDGSRTTAGSKSDWLRFPFPEGMHFTDDLVTPALTLAPGVELEMMPAAEDMKIKKAPGSGYLPVLAGVNDRFLPRCKDAPKDEAEPAVDMPHNSEEMIKSGPSDRDMSRVDGAAEVHHSLAVPCDDDEKHGDTADDEEQEIQEANNKEGKGENDDEEDEKHSNVQVEQGKNDGSSDSGNDAEDQ